MIIHSLGFLRQTRLHALTHNRVNHRSKMRVQYGRSIQPALVRADVREWHSPSHRMRYFELENSLIKLYHCMSARSFRPLWMLEELNIPYDLVILPFPPRAHDRSYLNDNPLGTIPLMIDGDTRMTESVAICQYLCARQGSTPLQVSAEETAFGSYLNYLHFGEATLTFPQTLVLRYAYFETPERRQPSVAKDYTNWFLARLKTLETLLTQDDYISANRFTAADISVGYALMLATHLQLEDRFTPAVATYWQRLQQRPAYQQALKVQKEAARNQGISEVPAPDLRPA
jgi:glutathione S-transferase